jgi:hypothetical protein
MTPTPAIKKMTDILGILYTEKQNVKMHPDESESICLKSEASEILSAKHK